MFGNHTLLRRNTGVYCERGNKPGHERWSKIAWECGDVGEGGELTPTAFAEWSNAATGPGSVKKKPGLPDKLPRGRLTQMEVCPEL